MAHLTHVSEMEKKIDTLSRITTILKDVIQNKVIYLGFERVLILMLLHWSPDALQIHDAICM